MNSQRVQFSLKALLLLIVIIPATTQPIKFLSPTNVCISAALCACGYALYQAATQKTDPELINEAQLYYQQADRAYHTIRTIYDQEIKTVHSILSKQEKLTMLEEEIQLDLHGLYPYTQYFDRLQRDTFEIKQHMPGLQYLTTAIIKHKTELLAQHSYDSGYYSLQDYHLYEFDRLMDKTECLINKLQILHKKLERVRSLVTHLPAYHAEKNDIEIQIYADNSLDRAEAIHTAADII
jgi:hypothetical protein